MPLATFRAASLPVARSYAIATVPGTVPVITTDFVDGGAGVVPELLPSPPPPHETRIIANKAKNNDAGRYVKRIFLISVALLPLLLVCERERFLLA